MLKGLDKNISTVVLWGTIPHDNPEGGWTPFLSITSDFRNKVVIVINFHLTTGNGFREDICFEDISICGLFFDSQQPRVNTIK